MISSGPTSQEGRAPAVADRTLAASPSERPVTVLRGAEVNVDPRRAGAMLIGLFLVVLTVVATVLLVAGIRKNDQAATLHDQGVPVAVTVSGCMGLLGGSGSNGAGYACRGTYTFEGHHYEQAIPGSSLLRTGTTIQGVVVPGDPELLSTPAMVAGQRASWRVFIAPSILFVVLLVASAALGIHRRRRGGRPRVVQKSAVGAFPTDQRAG